MGSERLYPVAPAMKESGAWIKEATFLIGKTPEGEQWILCEAVFQLYAHRFSSDGAYLGRAARAVANWDDILAWIDELGLTPATVHVRKFHSGLDGPTPDRFIGPSLAIYDQPSYFEDGDFGSEENREALVRWWHDLGAFVLFWDTTGHTFNGEGLEFY